MPKHTVKQGEDIDSIAYEYGFHPDTIWEHDDNKPLREKRQDPNVLKPDDEVIVPKLQVREAKVQTGRKHRFYRYGVLAILRVRFCEDEEPRPHVPYIFKIKTRCGKPIKDVKSQTDAKGYLLEPIPPNTTEGEIIFNPGDDEEAIPFRIGTINPANDGFQGIQSMLNNMGYYCGDEDDVLGELTIAAVREFQQQKMGLLGDRLLAEDAMGIDEDTLKAIEKEYSTAK